MQKEIGSEFWEARPQTGQREYFLSGRTALEFIIRDILCERTVTSVLMPSYCCHTMIEPFVRHGIQVRFYDVYFDELQGLSADIPKTAAGDILFYMAYFGYKHICGLNSSELRKRYSTIIEDKTHSCFCDDNESIADYTFASYRKWSGFSGIAEAKKNFGKFQINPKEETNETYILLREKASARKRVYINEGEGEKSEFLELYDSAEKLLEEDYIGYRPSYRAINDYINSDWKKIEADRRKNAIYLTDKLIKIEDVKLMFDHIDAEDVPLFVPILVSSNRQQLREFLINEQIYCPVHWPLSDLHNSASLRGKSLYEQEISIVCDQRYGKADMDRIVGAIRKYYS